VSIAILAMACFFTWFCHKRREILLALVASILWLGLSMWYFFGGDPLLPLGELANDIIAWAFFILMFIPLLFQINVEIKSEAKGRSWFEYGTPPREKSPSGYELYRKELSRRTRRYR